MFQVEIRRALARIGRRAFLAVGTDESSTIEEVVRAAQSMAAVKTGALIVLERRIGLAEYMERGIRLDARVFQRASHNPFPDQGPPARRCGGHYRRPHRGCQGGAAAFRRTGRGRET